MPKSPGNGRSVEGRRAYVPVHRDVGMLRPPGMPAGGKRKAAT
jgi:hypothetical protein